MILASESTKALREANLTRDCLKPMKFYASLNNDLKGKICNELQTPKKASRNRFVNHLGYSILSTLISSENIECIAQKKCMRIRGVSFVRSCSK